MILDVRKKRRRNPLDGPPSSIWLAVYLFMPFIIVIVVGWLLPFLAQLGAR